MVLSRVFGTGENAECRREAFRSTARSVECRDVALSATFGTIQVALPAGAGYRVDASTSFGTIDSELPITLQGVVRSSMQVSSDRLSGTIGDGRCTLTLNNRNGNIRIGKE